MRRAVVSTLLGNELRMLLRDRRTVVMSVLLPLVVMPLMLYGSRWSEQRRERRLAEAEVTYTLTGPYADTVRRLIALGSADSGRGEGEKAPPRLREVNGGDLAARLAKGELLLAIETGDSGPSAAAAAAKAEESDQGQGQEASVPGVPVVTLVFRGDRDESSNAMASVRALLRSGRTQLRSQLLQEHGFPVTLRDVGRVETRDIASAGQVAGLTLGRMLTLLLLVFVMSGGSVVAIDALAGEKERGTLETLLTSAASRGEIVAAKHLAILTVALVVTLIQVGNFLVYVAFRLIPAGAGWAAAVPPPVAALLLLLYLPVAALASSVLLLVSGRARTYKEAQLNFFPVFLLGVMPALAPFLPGLTLRSAIVVVPVANVAVAVKEILTGRFDWPMIALAWLATAAAAAWTARLGARTLSAERLVSAEERIEALGGPELFERRVLRWFAVMWAALMIVGGWLGEGRDIRVELLINLVVVFAGGSLLMIRAYRLRAREALALRAPHPAAWLAVLVGAPAALLTAIGAARLASRLLPVPPKVLEAFGQALLPEGIPFWQLLLLLTVLPGICEELAFRGVLLYGLRRKAHPVVVAFAVGVIFGLFHVALFRLVPTAFLGVVLAAVTMLTGSIFPAMVWHASNNLLGVLAGRYGWPLADLDADFYLAAAAVVVGAFVVLWRTRRPYPGLRR